ncbi:MAG TPA: GNAT family N-acetyltransferase [Gemmataceae bacterium]|nr:GNAT family N-acetyltransferase [Gemmataceae bacterium]
MSVRYFKRYKMEIDLYDAPPLPVLPPVYTWVSWDESLISIHADVKFRSFAGEIDATVFPSLSDANGCFHLMNEIAHKRGFLPEATWLLACPSGYVGTIQGIRDRPGLGAIQNLGVVPAHRGQHLGTALMLKALQGFRRAGLGRAFLEVTAINDAAVQLYRRLGFRCRKTLYRAVEILSDPSPLVGHAVASRHPFLD